MITLPPIKMGVRGTAALMVAAATIIGVLTILPATLPEGFIAVAILLGAVSLAARIPLWPVLRRLLWLAPFVASAALAAAWSRQGPDWRVLAARGGLSLYTIVLLGQLTTPATLITVLQRARLPGLLVTTLTLMHRYVFLLADESNRMGRARAARTFTRSRRFAWQSAASVVGVLFVRAYERAERVYDALLARGWRS